jgi:hypothetical protein
LEELEDINTLLDDAKKEIEVMCTRLNQKHTNVKNNIDHFYDELSKNSDEWFLTYQRNFFQILLTI